MAQSSGEVVSLPDGDRVAIGTQGPALLATYDSGRLEAVLWQLIDEGRPDDATAVLAYVARHRPADASTLAVIGLRIVTDLNDQARARTLVTAIAAESKAAPDALLASVKQAGLSGDFWSDDSNSMASAEEVAGLEPAAGSLPGGDRAGVPSQADSASIAAAANSPEYGGYGGGGAGFGGGLPPGLNIGGGSGGGGRPPVPPGPPPGIPDPPTGGGMSR